MTDRKTQSRARARTEALIIKGVVRDRPLNCERCGRDAVSIQAHHPDYDDPANIEWLCSSCHRLHHLDVGKDTPRVSNPADWPEVEQLRSRYVTVRTVVRRLKLSRARVYSLIKQKRIKSIKRFGLILVHPEELERFASQERRTGRPALNGKSPAR